MSAADRGGSRSSVGPTSASPHCSTRSPDRSGSSWTRSPGRPATRWTNSSRSPASSGGSSTRLASGGGSTKRGAPTSMPRCGRKPRWRRPRSPSCSSTRVSRSPSRTSGSSSRSSTPGGRWSWPTTSGTRSMRSGATTWSARSRRSSSRSRGRRGSTCRPRPVGTWTSSSQPWSSPWRRGTPACRRPGSTPSSARSLRPTRTRFAAGKQPRILVRHPGIDATASVRAVRVGVRRGGLSEVRRAQAARAVRFRGDADRGVGPGAGEAQALALGVGLSRWPAFRRD
jgi:hypothetical protein